MNPEKYTFFTDPGHGWLAVPMDELRRLGIAEEISGFSYRNGDTAYLEEDDDYGRFVLAKKALGEPIDMIDVYHDQSPVRSYRDYYPD